MEVGGQSHVPAALPPGKSPGTHCIGSWVGPRASLDGCGKSRTLPGFDPRTVQPVASRYTDWAIPVPSRVGLVMKLKGMIRSLFQSVIPDRNQDKREYDEN